jgi:glycosyltransferase involved in cell wall biosynthesis
MKILTFTSLFPSRERPNFGIFIYQRLAHVAQRPGNAAEVISPVPYFPSWVDSEDWSAFARTPHVERLHALRVNHPRYLMVPGVSMQMHGGLIFSGSLRTARALHRRFQFDCIDAHYVYPDGFAAILLGKALKLPVVVSARGTDINSFSQMPTIRPMIRWTLRRASKVIAVSQALADSMIALGTPPSKISVIPNGVDVERFHPVDRALARQNLGLSPDAKIAVAVGSLTEGKGHALLIEAMATLAKDHPEYQLYIIGLGPLREQLLKMTDDFHLGRNAFVLGSRPNEELQAWFSAADVSCLVSAREGWPNVVTESLACGTPLIATRVGGVPEILVNDELGIFVKPTAESVAKGLQAAFERAWDREAIARQGASRDWNAVAGEVEAVLQDAVGDYSAKRKRR